MVQNYPGPYELRFKYTTKPLSVARLEHSQRLSLDLTTVPDPGTAFNNINAITRGGIQTPDLGLVVEAWLGLMAGRMPDTAEFSIVELWKYVPLSFVAQFISSYSPTRVAGGHPSGSGVAQQDIYTFRTIEGGIFRMNMMEASETAYRKSTAPIQVAGIDNTFNFIISSENWILARDTSYPFSMLNFLVGQNERLFKLRYR